MSRVLVLLSCAQLFGCDMTGVLSAGDASSSDDSSMDPTAPLDAYRPAADASYGTATGEPGVWEHIALPVSDEGPVESLPNRHFDTVVNDPARPSDFYLAAGRSGGRMRWYRSTDFGLHWELINNGDIWGVAWGFSIDPNPDRDPSTPPTLWTPAGYGSNGAWKSTDGGFTWERSAGADAAYGPVNPNGATATDLYHVQILPEDPPNHVLATYHYGWIGGGPGGLGETWDGGRTWVLHDPPEGFGTSHYVLPISGTTWCLISQESGMWRTTTAGRVGGTPEHDYRDGTISTAAWARVDDHIHYHGSHQSISVDGAWYSPGIDSLERSDDGGATWRTVASGFLISSVVATTSFFYGANGDTPFLSRAWRSSDTEWDLDYTVTPSGMTQGPGAYGQAASYDAASDHWVVLQTAWDTGLWRYVEP